MFFFPMSNLTNSRYVISLQVQNSSNVQLHYDMNTNLEMLIEKFQMLVSAYVSNKQKSLWLKHWNQFEVLFESQKFPKHGFLWPLFSTKRVLLTWSLFLSLCSRLEVPISIQLHFLYLQLEVEDNNLYKCTIEDLVISLKGGLNVETILEFITRWRLELWETEFFFEFKQERGVQWGKTWELQYGSKKAVMHVMQR